MTKDELDWLEKQANLNMDFHLKNIDALSKEVHLTLTLLFVAIPASLNYAVKWYLMEDYRTLGCTMALLCIYLWFIAVYLARAIKARDIMASGNEPAKLRTFIIQQHTQHPKSATVLEDVREGELLNLQERIDDNRRRSEETATVVNRSRWLIVATPLLFLMLLVVVFIFRSVLAAFL